MSDLVLPGLYGSGPGHWQTWWLTAGRHARLVEQKDWDNPHFEDWRRQLATAVERSPGAILIAHSLSCALVAQLAAWRSDLPIGGALLVAPADVDDPSWATPAIGSFGPMPLQRLPFPSIVAASRNDPYVTFNRADVFARCWNSDFVDVGEKGHISTDDGFGPWPEGLRLAQRLEKHLRAVRRLG